MGVASLFPARTRPFLRAARASVQAAALRGNQVSCPICGGNFRRFLEFRGRQNARCPRCGALERHRAALTILQTQTNLFTAQLRVLHFAPEQGLSRILRAARNLDYVTADIRPGAADLTMDITDIDAPDESFDVVLCSHVMEHIQDDMQAMREIRRILRRDGWAFIIVPFDPSRTEIYEDPTITSPEGRLAAFGQSDHVRYYSASGFEQRLQQAGFSVQRAEVDDPELRERYSLINAGVIEDWAALCTPTKGRG